MARKPDEILAGVIGQLNIQIALMQSQIEQVLEENAALKEKLALPKAAETPKNKNAG